MASMTLPIWREKIAAGIAAAQAAKKASEAKLGAAQIALAVQCAEKRYLAREAARNLETLRNSLVPKAAQALDAARSAYAANGVDFLTLLEAERTLLNFDVETAAAVLQKNSSLAELSIVLAGNPPSEASYQDLNIGQGKPIHNSK
jgi:outer membrane protein TolC